eukprot:1148297-Pelagomonas_calceolata.AAC.8
MSLLRQLGRAVAKPFVSAGLQYDATARQWPLTTGIVTTVRRLLHLLHYCCTVQASHSII